MSNEPPQGSQTYRRPVTLDKRPAEVEITIDFDVLFPSLGLEALQTPGHKMNVWSGSDRIMTVGVELKK